MKTINILFAILLLLLSCTNNEEEPDAYGNFESQEILVASEANGQLLEFNATEGMELKKKDILGVIDTTQLHLQKERLIAQKNTVIAKKTRIKAEIDVLKEQKKNLLREKNRIKNLYKEEAATEKQWEDIQGEVDVMNQRIKASKSEYSLIKHERESVNKQIAQLDDRIRQCYITNPVNGTILETYAEEGELASTGRNLYKIANLSNLILRVYVSGAQLPHIKIGQEVTVRIDKNKEENQELTGTISWIAQSAEFTPKVIQTKEERVSLVYAVKVRVPNDGRLKIGMPGEVVFD